MLIDRQEKAVIRDCLHGLVCHCPFIWIPFRYFLPFISGFPYPKLRYDVCAAVRPSLQGTEGCARSTAVCIIPLHAGASTCRNNRYSAIWASCLVVAPAHSAFCPYLSFPGRLRHGQTVTHSACAVRRASGMSQAERVSFLFARQTVSFTHPSRHSFYQMPFIQAAGQFLFYLRLLPAVIPCLPPHRFYRVRM